MDELNLYDDLDDFQEQQEKKSKELQEAEDKYQQALKTIEELREENKTLKKNIQRIELGFQSLLDTARNEIKRKDKEIERLRKENDDICFRRKVPQKNHERSHNPFNKQTKDESSATVTDLQKTSYNNNEKTETYKRSRFHDHEVEHSIEPKKHRGSREQQVDDPKESRSRYREHDNDFKRESNRHYSRDGKDYDKPSGSRLHSPERYDKHHKKSHSPQRNDKHYRNRSRERDRYDNKHHHLDSNRSRERNIHSQTKTTQNSAKSPQRNTETKCDHYQTEKSSKVESDKSHKSFDKDLGKHKAKQVKDKEEKQKSPTKPAEKPKKTSDNKLPLKQDKNNSDLKSTNKSSPVKKTDNQSSDSLKNLKQNITELENDIYKDMEINLATTSSDTKKLCTPRKVALFNELFGESPSDSFTSKTNIPAKSSLVEVVSSATTSPGDYTDIDSNKTTPKDDIIEIISSCNATPDLHKDVNDNQQNVKVNEKILQDDNEIDNCFIPNKKSEEEVVKTIACMDLTEVLNDDMADEIEYVHIPGLDLCVPTKDKDVTNENSKILEEKELIVEDNNLIKEKTESNKIAEKIFGDINNKTENELLNKNSTEISDEHNENLKTNTCMEKSTEIRGKGVVETTEKDIEDLQDPKILLTNKNKSISFVNSTTNAINDENAANSISDNTENVVIETVICDVVPPLENPYSSLNTKDQIVSDEQKNPANLERSSDTEIDKDDSHISEELKVTFNEEENIKEATEKIEDSTEISDNFKTSSVMPTSNNYPNAEVNIEQDIETLHQSDTTEWPTTTEKSNDSSDLSDNFKTSSDVLESYNDLNEQENIERDIETLHESDTTVCNSSSSDSKNLNKESAARDIDDMKQDKSSTKETTNIEIEDDESTECLSNEPQMTEQKDEGNLNEVISVEDEKEKESTDVVELSKQIKSTVDIVPQISFNNENDSENKSHRKEILQQTETGDGVISEDEQISFILEAAESKLEDEKPEKLQDSTENVSVSITDEGQTLEDKQKDISIEDNAVEDENQINCAVANELPEQQTFEEKETDISIELNVVEDENQINTTSVNELPEDKVKNKDSNITKAGDNTTPSHTEDIIVTSKSNEFNSEEKKQPENATIDELSEVNASEDVQKDESNTMKTSDNSNDISNEVNVIQNENQINSTPVYQLREQNINVKQTEVPNTLTATVNSTLSPIEDVIETTKSNIFNTVEEKETEPAAILELPERNLSEDVQKEESNAIKTSFNPTSAIKESVNTSNSDSLMDPKNAKDTSAEIEDSILLEDPENINESSNQVEEVSSENATDNVAKNSINEIESNMVQTHLEKTSGNINSGESTRAAEKESDKQISTLIKNTVSSVNPENDEKSSNRNKDISQEIATDDVSKDSSNEIESKNEQTLLEKRTENTNSEENIAKATENVEDDESDSNGDLDKITEITSSADVVKLSEPNTEETPIKLVERVEEDFDEIKTILKVKQTDSIATNQSSDQSISEDVASEDSNVISSENVIENELSVDKLVDLTKKSINNTTELTVNQIESKDEKNQEPNLSKHLEKELINDEVTTNNFLNNFPTNKAPVGIEKGDAIVSNSIETTATSEIITKDINSDSQNALVQNEDPNNTKISEGQTLRKDVTEKQITSGFDSTEDVSNVTQNKHLRNEESISKTSTQVASDVIESKESVEDPVKDEENCSPNKKIYTEDVSKDSDKKDVSKESEDEILRNEVINNVKTSKTPASDAGGINKTMNSPSLEIAVNDQENCSSIKENLSEIAIEDEVVGIQVLNQVEKFSETSNSMENETTEKASDIISSTVNINKEMISDNNVAIISKLEIKESKTLELETSKEECNTINHNTVKDVLITEDRGTVLKENSSSSLKSDAINNKATIEEDANIDSLSFSSKENPQSAKLTSLITASSNEHEINEDKLKDIPTNLENSKTPKTNNNSVLLDGEKSLSDRIQHKVEELTKQHSGGKSVIASVIDSTDSIEEVAKVITDKTTNSTDKMDSDLVVKNTLKEPTIPTSNMTEDIEIQSTNSQSFAGKTVNLLKLKEKHIDLTKDSNEQNSSKEPINKVADETDNQQQDESPNNSKQKSTDSFALPRIETLKVTSINKEDSTLFKIPKEVKKSPKKIELLSSDLNEAVAIETKAKTVKESDINDLKICESVSINKGKSYKESEDAGKTNKENTTETKNSEIISIESKNESVEESETKDLEISENKSSNKADNIVGVQINTDILLEFPSTKEINSANNIPLLPQSPVKKSEQNIVVNTSQQIAEPNCSFEKPKEVDLLEKKHFKIPSKVNLPVGTKLVNSINTITLGRQKRIRKYKDPFKNCKPNNEEMPSTSGKSIQNMEQVPPETQTNKEIYLSNFTNNTKISQSIRADPEISRNISTTIIQPPIDQQLVSPIKIPKLCNPNNLLKAFISKEINIEGEIVEVVKVQMVKEPNAAHFNTLLTNHDHRKEITTVSPPIITSSNAAQSNTLLTNFVTKQPITDFQPTSTSCQNLVPIPNTTVDISGYRLQFQQPEQIPSLPAVDSSVCQNPAQQYPLSKAKVSRNVNKKKIILEKRSIPKDSSNIPQNFNNQLMLPSVSTLPPSQLQPSSVPPLHWRVKNTGTQMENLPTQFLGTNPITVSSNILETCKLNSTNPQVVQQNLKSKESVRKDTPPLVSLTQPQKLSPYAVLPSISISSTPTADSLGRDKLQFLTVHKLQPTIPQQSNQILKQKEISTVSKGEFAIEQNIEKIIPLEVCETSFKEQQQVHTPKKLQPMDSVTTELNKLHKNVDISIISEEVNEAESSNNKVIDKNLAGICQNTGEDGQNLTQLQSNSLSIKEGNNTAISSAMREESLKLATVDVVQNKTKELANIVPTTSTISEFAASDADQNKAKELGEISKDSVPTTPPITATIISSSISIKTDSSKFVSSDAGQNKTIELGTISKDSVPMTTSISKLASSDAGQNKTTEQVNISKDTVPKTSPIPAKLQVCHNTDISSNISMKSNSYKPASLDADQNTTKEQENFPKDIVSTTSPISKLDSSDAGQNTTKEQGKFCKDSNLTTSPISILASSDDGPNKTKEQGKFSQDCVSKTSPLTKLTSSDTDQNKTNEVGKVSKDIIPTSSPTPASLQVSQIESKDVDNLSMEKLQFMKSHKLKHIEIDSDDLSKFHKQVDETSKEISKTNELSTISKSKTKEHLSESAAKEDCENMKKEQAKKDPKCREGNLTKIQQDVEVTQKECTTNSKAESANQKHLSKAANLSKIQQDVDLNQKECPVYSKNEPVIKQNVPIATCLETHNELETQQQFKTPKKLPKEPIEKHAVSTIPSTLPESYTSHVVLPSISTNSPTPSNFSGIFSKKSTTEEVRKKSPHCKPREYILPAASVLCNVDNLENATKASKKLHWELLANKNELHTEIEDDADADTTDEEPPKIKEEPIDITSSPKQSLIQQDEPTTQRISEKSSHSETDTQTEDVSLLRDIRKQQAGTFKKSKLTTPSKLHKLKHHKHKLCKKAKSRLKSKDLTSTSPFKDNTALITQMPFSIVFPKRPVGRPRKYPPGHKHIKLEIPKQHKKRGRKPKHKPKEPQKPVRKCIIMESKLGNIFETKSRESSTQNGPENSSNSNQKFAAVEMQNIENSVKILSTSVERLEICDNEPCTSSESSKLRKTFDKSLLGVIFEDDHNVSMIYHKQDSSTDHIKNEQDASIDNNMESTKIDSQTKEIRENMINRNNNKRDEVEVKEFATNSDSIVRQELPSTSKTNQDMERNDNESDNCEELPTSSRAAYEKVVLLRSDSDGDKVSSSMSSEEHSQDSRKHKSLKSRKLRKPLLKKKLKSKIKNKVTPLISLEDIGIKVRPLKVHLSSFRIPKVKKDAEETIDNTWKLETYIEVEKEGDEKEQNEVNEEQQTEENVEKPITAEVKEHKAEVVNKTNTKDSVENDSHPNKSKSITKKISESTKNSKESSNEIKEVAKESRERIGTPTNYIINFDNKIKTGKRKLFSPDMYEGDEVAPIEVNREITADNSAERFTKQCLYLSREHELNPVKLQRKSLHFTSENTESPSSINTTESVEKSSNNDSTKGHKKPINVHRRILDSSGEEDDNNEVNNKKNELETYAAKESNEENCDLKNKKLGKVIQKSSLVRRKSMYVERSSSPVIAVEEIQTNKPLRRKSLYVEKTTFESTDTEDNKSIVIKEDNKPPLKLQSVKVNLKSIDCSKHQLLSNQEDKSNSSNEKVKKKALARRKSVYIERPPSSFDDASETETSKPKKPMRRKSMYVEKSAQLTNEVEEDKTQKSSKATECTNLLLEPINAKESSKSSKKDKEKKPRDNEESLENTNHVSESQSVKDNSKSSTKNEKERKQRDNGENQEAPENTNLLLVARSINDNSKSVKEPKSRDNEENQQNVAKSSKAQENTNIPLEPQSTKDKSKPLKKDDKEHKSRGNEENCKEPKKSLMVRRKSMYVEKSTLESEEIGPIKPNKPVRRKSMYVEKAALLKHELEENVSSNASIDSKLASNKQSAIEKTKLIEKSEEEPKPIKSLKMCRKSMYVEPTCSEIKSHEKNKEYKESSNTLTKTRDTKTPEVQQQSVKNVDKSQPEVPLETSETVSEPTKTITSFKMRRKSLYMERNLLNNEENKKVSNESIKQKSDLEKHVSKPIKNQEQHSLNHSESKENSKISINTKQQSVINSSNQKPIVVHGKSKHQAESRVVVQADKKPSIKHKDEKITKSKLEENPTKSKKSISCDSQEKVVNKLESNKSNEISNKTEVKCIDLEDQSADDLSEQPPIKKRRKSTYQPHTSDSNDHSENLKTSTASSNKVLEDLKKKTLDSDSNSSEVKTKGNTIKARRKSVYQQRISEHNVEDLVKKSQDIHSVSSSKPNLTVESKNTKQTTEEISDLANKPVLERNTKVPEQLTQKPIQIRRKSMYQTQIEDSSSSLIKESNKKEIKVKSKESEKALNVNEKCSNQAEDSDSSIVLTQQKSIKIRRKSINQLKVLDTSSDDENDNEPLLKKTTVIDNEIKTPLTTSATKTRQRRKRVVKVLSTSMESPSTSANSTSQHSSVPASPLTSPTFNHPIFNNEVSTQSSEFVASMPMTPNQQDDNKFKEIDSKLHAIFQSPQYTVDYKISPAVDAANLALLPPPMDEPKLNMSLDETQDLNQENIQSSANISQLNDTTTATCLNDSSAAHNNSEVKQLSLGSSEYRFEKVSDNVINLFISRKRKRKRTN